MNPIITVPPDPIAVADLPNDPLLQLVADRAGVRIETVVGAFLAWHAAQDDPAVQDQERHELEMN